MPQERSSYLARFAAMAAVLSLILVAIVASVKTPSESVSTSGGSAAPAPVAVRLAEYSITPSKIVVPYGGSITVTNGGTMNHNLTVLNSSVATPDIVPGGQAVLDVSTLSQGTYQVECSVPGHKDLGMSGTLTITGSGSGSSATASGSATTMPGMSTSGAMTDSAVSNLVAGTAAAAKMNAQMEKTMTGGVTSYLAWAKKYAAGQVKTGNNLLAPTILPDGTKRFDLTAAITKWEVAPGRVVKAWTYNGVVPGPWIKVNTNDKVEVVIHNKLPIDTDIHFHGIDVPNNMDGVAPITQPYIKPGTTFTYKFTAPADPELGMYHAHMDGNVSVVNGLFADFQVGDVPLPLGKTIDGITIPANLKIAKEIPMVLNDAGVIGLSINGKAFPETAPIVVKQGQWILVDYFNEGLQIHPMHLHRQPQIVVAKDGWALTSPYRMDTIAVAPGERYSVLIRADAVGTWAWHCHILSHAEANGGLANMVTTMIVQ